MKSSTEETKFRNPASTLAFASSGERAHLPREGSMQTNTYSTGPNGSGFGRNTSPSASDRAFIRASRYSYEARKRSPVGTPTPSSAPNSESESRARSLPMKSPRGCASSEWPWEERSPHDRLPICSQNRTAGGQRPGQRPLPGPLAQIRPHRTTRRQLTPRITKCRSRDRQRRQGMNAYASCPEFVSYLSAELEECPFQDGGFGLVVCCGPL